MDDRILATIAKSYALEVAKAVKEHEGDAHRLAYDMVDASPCTNEPERAIKIYQTCDIEQGLKAVSKIKFPERTTFSQLACAIAREELYARTMDAFYALPETDLESLKFASWN